MNIKRTSSGLPPAAAGNDTGNETGKTSGPISGDGIAKADQISRTNRPDGARRAGRTRQAESEDLARLKAAVSGYATRDLNDPARTKEVVAKVARELVESGTQSLPHLTAQQKADLAKFAENDPVISTKILSFVREQVGQTLRLRVAVKTKNGSTVQAHELNLANPVALGRGPESAIGFEGDEVSREHIGFSVTHGRLTVTDLSSNGSWLNRFRLNPNQPYLVNPGDLVEIPGYEIAIVELQAETPPAAPGAAARKLPFTLSGTEKILLAATLAVIAFFVLYLRS